jgi:hypothetical protein
MPSDASAGFTWAGYRGRILIQYTTIEVQLPRFPSLTLQKKSTVLDLCTVLSLIYHLVNRPRDRGHLLSAPSSKGNKHARYSHHRDNPQSPQIRLDNRDARSYIGQVL